MYFAAALGHLEVVRALVTELGAEVNQAIQNGCTPVFIAAYQGHLEVVRALVTELGADVNQAKQDGTTPLYIAAQNGHLEVVRALVTELGADVNQAMKDSVTSRALMTELGANAMQDIKDSITPVVIAAHMGHDQVAKYLARHGADISVFSQQLPNVAKSNDLAQWLESKSSCANPECVKGGEKRCARCLKVRYCSRECQVAHFRTHKVICKPPVDQ